MAGIDISLKESGDDSLTFFGSYTDIESRGGSVEVLSVSRGKATEVSSISLFSLTLEERLKLLHGLAKLLLEASLVILVLLVNELKRLTGVHKSAKLQIILIANRILFRRRKSRSGRLRSRRRLLLAKLLLAKELASASFFGTSSGQSFSISGLLTAGFKIRIN